MNVRNHPAGLKAAVLGLAGAALLGACGMTEAGEWLVRAGGHSVDPKSGNHPSVDFAVNDDWFVNVDARWVDIDSNARLSGARIGTVAIDPRAFGISIGRRLGGK